MKKIILIDDDRDDAELFEEALAEISSNISFTHYEDCPSALCFLENNTDSLPELIFLDINIPTFSGWQCLTKLKSEPALAQVPVIMYTTSSLPREKQIATDLGAMGFITKPTNFNDLKKVLRNAILNGVAQ